MKIRDLVAVRAPDRDSSGSGLGIVLNIDKDFYSHIDGKRTDRVHVMWSNATITYEPAVWLCNIEEQEETKMIYSYKCTKCDHEFDREHSVSDVDDTKCEKCGEDSSRIISVPPAFILKGSGWAKDGYK